MVAVRTAGAPGPETLLMRTGRAAEAAGAAPEDRRVGAAELEVVRMVAVYDAAFAVVSGRVDDCAVRAGDGPRPAGRGERPERLVREAVRRVEALKRLPSAVLPHDDRLVVAPGTGREAAGGPPLRREILLLADGRRTCRDLAYATAHGVYAVTVEVSRMLGDGLLERAVPEAGAPGAAGEAKPILPRGPVPDRAAPAGPQSLPRRLPGHSGIGPSRTEEKRPKNWAEFARFRDLAR